MTPRVSHTKAGEALTARISPAVSSPAVRSAAWLPHGEAKPRVPSMWPDELGIELASVHGGAVARPAVG
jgi:hypothetical protein